MTDEEQREWALNEADRMRIMASEAEQLGAMFGIKIPAYVRFLRKNADAAMKWAARREDKSPKRSASTHR